jgi:hypothetical protein
MDTTIDATAYSRYCGPRSLASAMSVSRVTAAHLLLGIQRHRGAVHLPGTDVEDMQLGLDVIGLGAEVWDPLTRASTGSAAECIARARAAAPRSEQRDPERIRDDIHAVIAASPPESQPRMWAHLRNKHAAQPRLREWLALPGEWLVVVHVIDMTHWVAARDHAVLVTEDGQYVDESPVVTALRVIRSPAV